MRTGAAPGGDAAEGEPNSDFLSLWLRFLVSVSAYARAKNIDAVFDAAERAGAALLIDEADALFGKLSNASTDS